MTSERSKTDRPQCPLCPAGTLREGTTTLTMERGEATIVFKDVPADVCDTCGEAFVGENISEDVYQQAEAAIEAGAHFDVRYYKAPQKTAA